MTGRGEDAGQTPLGEALERAASRLDAAAALSAAAREGEEGPAGVVIDPVTWALLDVRSEVAEQGGQLWLQVEREVGEEARKRLRVADGRRVLLT